MKHSQTSAVLAHLITHTGLTSMEAFKLYGVTRLSAIIFVLRRRGHRIINIDRECTNRFNGTSRFVEYRLIK